MSLEMEATIAELAWKRISKPPDRPALYVKQEGRFEARPWTRLADDVLRGVDALIALGVSVGDRVAQWSENRYEWIVADLAMQLAGAIHVPLHASLSGEQAIHQLADSGANLLLISNHSLSERLLPLVPAIPGDLRCMTFDQAAPTLHDRCVGGWHERLAAASPERGKRLAERMLGQIHSQSTASLLYTSGTAGEPRAVMLSQGNLATNAYAMVEAFGSNPDELRLAFLPVSHIYARTCDLYTWLAAGSYLAFAERRETVLDDCATIRPTFMNGVPFFYDRVMRALIERGLASIPGALRQLLGGRLRNCACGGAALSDAVYDFFHDRGVPLLPGYGLTESSPVISACTPSSFRRGSVGRAVPGVSVRIASDGEIVTRGPHVMQGYWNDPVATAEAIRDSELYTGDLGYLDADGYLYITGRKKEILVTTGGKNVSPWQLESLLNADPLIQQVVVLGDQRDYLAALIVPEREALTAELARRGCDLIAGGPCLEEPAVLAIYRERIDQRLAGLSKHEQVRRFALLPRAFALERGELTHKLSLRRKSIEVNFAREIAALYHE